MRLLIRQAERGVTFTATVVILAACGLRIGGPLPVGTLTAEEARLCADNSIVGGSMLTEVLREADAASSLPNDVIHAYYSGRVTLHPAQAEALDERCRGAVPILRERDAPIQ